MGIKEALTNATASSRDSIASKVSGASSKLRQDAKRAQSAAAKKRAELTRKSRRDVRRAEQLARRQAAKERRGEGVVAALGEAGRGIEPGGLDSQEQAMFARAQDSAMMGAPIADATLQPLSAPEQTDAVAGGRSSTDSAVDSMVMSGADDGEGVDSLVIGGDRGDQDDIGFFDIGDGDGGLI